jgi:hypothetical protein
MNRNWERRHPYRRVAVVWKFAEKAARASSMPTTPRKGRKDLESVSGVSDLSRPDLRLKFTNNQTQRIKNA